MNWLDLIKAIFGEAEQVVPIFIHNPKSQKIEAVIATTAEHALSLIPSATAPAAKN